ncbi:hypothetical protein BDW62DRAFT_5023 [Aspergillus aurantiobrunneus]
MLSKHIRSQLNPPEEKAQHTRSAMFLDGLNQAGDVFSRRFRVTNPGLRRAHWAYDSDALKRKLEDIMSDAEVFLSKEDFREQAKTLQGSRDFGAQLFCALLRSVAVEARLVCSLQPLPFSGTMELPPKPKPQPIVISSDDHDSLTEGQTKSDFSRASPIRRLGRPSFKPTQVQRTFTTRPTQSESSYPVFWVEAFNEAFQKWIAIDPMVTRTLAKPHRLEPPATDPYNLLSYVVAFEDDASMRDVTRRYTKVFNAKTRKLRVESTKNGEVWWKRVLQHFEKPFLEDRDELEIGELTAKTASEPMPRNAQDFKDHPIYALERQLRRNEIIFPKRVIGHVSLGKTGAKRQSEPVYRRSDVHTLRSANKWYRLGRDIKMGEQALKRIPVRSRGINIDDEDTDMGEQTTLYAFSQTELYKPPPVVQGRVPKNAYGNLDIYVPSMVPPGGVHIKHLDAAYAARILGIDYADAVTGFNFKGRHGTAILQGVVVATEFWEAMEEVLKCLEEEKLHDELEERSSEVLRAWKNVLMKLRIAERVKGYAVEGEADDEASGLEKSEPEEMGGGFFPESDAEMPNPPQLLPGRAPEPAEDEEMGGGFVPESEEETPSLVHQRQTPKLADDANRDEPPSRTERHPAGGFVSEGESTRPNVSGRRLNATAPPRYSLVVVPNNAPDVPVSEQRHITQNPTQDHGPAWGALGNSVDEPITVASSNNDSASASVEILSRAPSQVQSRTQSVEALSPHSEVNEEDNEGSLLSQDPEDEDAVPEWLMSD